MYKLPRGCIQRDISLPSSLSAAVVGNWQRMYVRQKKISPKSSSSLLSLPSPLPSAATIFFCFCFCFFFWVSELRSQNPMEGLIRSSANYVPLSPISFLKRSALVYRDRTSVVYGDVRYTWKDTLERCTKLASALAQLGISRGDVVSTKHWLSQFYS